MELEIDREREREREREMEREMERYRGRWRERKINVGLIAGYRLHLESSEQKHLIKPLRGRDRGLPL